MDNFVVIYEFLKNYTIGNRQNYIICTNVFTVNGYDTNTNNTIIKKNSKISDILHLYMTMICDSGNNNNCG